MRAFALLEEVACAPVELCAAFLVLGALTRLGKSLAELASTQWTLRRTRRTTFASMQVWTLVPPRTGAFVFPAVAFVLLFSIVIGTSHGRSGSLFALRFGFLHALPLEVVVNEALHTSVRPIRIMDAQTVEQIPVMFQTRMVANLFEPWYSVSTAGFR